MKPNKPDAVNPAMALLFAMDDQLRRVTDLGRSLRRAPARRESREVLAVGRCLTVCLFSRSTEAPDA